MLIKIVTFNMAHGKGMDGVINLEKQAEIINSYKPDIVFLQEIGKKQERQGSTRATTQEFSCLNDCVGALDSKRSISQFIVNFSCVRQQSSL